MGREGGKSGGKPKKGEGGQIKPSAAGLQGDDGRWTLSQAVKRPPFLGGTFRPRCATNIVRGAHFPAHNCCLGDAMLGGWNLTFSLAGYRQGFSGPEIPVRRR